MSELSKNQYRDKLRALIDQNILDPDELFKRVVQHYFVHDPEDDFIWDCQDDMEEIFDAFGGVLASNFRGQPPGSSAESDDAKRFRKVRNWVENTEYRPNSTQLVRASRMTNTTGKFDKRMDAVMHFLAGAQVATYSGETLADFVSFGVEVTDEIKSLYKYLVEGRQEIGYDSVDLAWGRRGSELENAFDVSESNARALARKFATGTFTLSRWQQWYKKPDAVLYS